MTSLRPRKTIFFFSENEQGQPSSKIDCETEVLYCPQGKTNRGLTTALGRETNCSSLRFCRPRRGTCSHLPLQTDEVSISSSAQTDEFSVEDCAGSKKPPSRTTSFAFPCLSAKGSCSSSTLATSPLRTCSFFPPKPSPARQYCSFVPTRLSRRQAQLHHPRQ